ncbi:MAG: stage III sporulation protein AD [Lachnospiraceae bacterium]|nr:stage III sporulation protein AD [Lachnospiraceae bacterium]MDD7078500.1 SpoIIIAC/SpoIIIAD family protein [Lachnospiraceae bacterium]MDY3731005.1 SpoIIIAC/SpoIIIAD family protein [Candidatus Choladocola sp.]
MDMIKIACLGLSGVMLGLILRQAKSSLAEVVSLATCLLIVFYSATKLSSVFEMINSIGSYFSEQKEYFRILLKIIGITYLADFASNICKDAGYSAIAGQIEIFGKISILAISSPIILALLEAVHSFL